MGEVFLRSDEKLIPLFMPPKQDVRLTLAELEETLTGRWWGQGPKVGRFESEFGMKFGFPWPLMVNSGTAALHLAYVLAGVKAGDEVIIPVLTCTATCHPLKHLGAKIVFADIRSDTLTADPDDVWRKLSARTKAIVVVHLGGVLSDVEEWKTLQQKTGLTVIEDAAQALGAEGVGFGDYTCLSFQAIKVMSTGDGGMLCCKRAEDYERARRLRWFDIDRDQKAGRNWQAWDRRGITFDQVEPGYKFQPTDIDACLGLSALTTVSASLSYRGALARAYTDRLRGCDRVKIVGLGADSANWLFMVLVNGDRDDFARHLLEAGIETNVAHIRNDLFTVFGGERLPLPGMNQVERQYICLPINDYVTLDQVGYICDTIEGWRVTP
jgi:perosamine synthetase